MCFQVVDGPDDESYQLVVLMLTQGVIDRVVVRLLLHVSAGFM